MAVRRAFIDTWVDQHGPWLLHVCRSEGCRGQVLEQGLIPGAGARAYQGPLAGRPGHVYLATPPAAARVGEQIYEGVGDGACETAPWVAVDVRALDPQRINPDEDCFFVSWICDDPVDLRGLPDPNMTVRDDDALLYEQRQTMDWAAFNARPYRSYGEWAAGVELGSDPQMTEQAWTDVGSLAYDGTIPATALRAASVTVCGDVTVLGGRVSTTIR